MTKKELSQLYWLNREIEYQQKRLDELRAAATSCTAKITGMPHSLNMLDKIGNYAAEIADLEGIMQANIQKCFYELNRLNRYIQGVGDTRMRMIISLRCISGMTWNQVAESMGGESENSVKQAYHRYFKQD